MFVNTEHLPQRLSPEHYSSPEILQREMETLFIPGWHCIAAKSQIPHIGDYRTLDILDRPLICWNTSNGYQTFLNVCTHRFSTLTDQRTGNAKNRLKCQYHGWEFDEQGNTCRIPDAQCFRPLVKGELGLREYQTETVGQLIFVSFQEDPIPLREYLGAELVAFCEEWFAADSRIVYTVDQDFESNWKIAVENAIESYHIECVHPKSFGNYPREEECTHLFHRDYDHFIHDYTHRCKHRSTWEERLLSAFAGTTPELKYHNLLRYPGIIFGKGALVGYIQMFWPVGPNRCRNFSLFMDQPGPSDRWLSKWNHVLLRYFGGAFVRRVLSEDASIYPSVYRGTTSVDRPHGGGLISIREERVFAFQDKILEALNEHRVPDSNPVAFVIND